MDWKRISRHGVFQKGSEFIKNKGQKKKKEQRAEIMRGTAYMRKNERKIEFVRVEDAVRTTGRLKESQTLLWATSQFL